MNNIAKIKEKIIYSSRIELIPHQMILTEIAKRKKLNLLILMRQLLESGKRMVQFMVRNGIMRIK
jgi:hypothetical protein